MDAVVKIVEPKRFIEGKVYCEGLTPAGSEGAFLSAA